MLDGRIWESWKLVALAAAITGALAAAEVPERAAKLHRDALVFDGHVHIANRQFHQGGDIGDRYPDGQVDLPRMREGGLDAKTADARAQELLSLLNVPEGLWPLPPATFSGGEQQRVNIARGLIADRPVLLLDEPTASLDARNRAVVVDLIERKKRSGVAIVGIFHDEDVRDAVATRVVDVTHFAAKAA